MARPGGSGPPLSFKTVPGRHRTQKWNVAKQYDYSGDDWGGYDPYDDYGQPQQEQQQYSAPPAIPPEYANYPTTQLPSQHRGPPGRQMSFDQPYDDDRRQFSAGPMLYSSADQARGVSPAKSAKSATSSGGKPSGEYGRRPRDFTNPEQVPPPLNTQSPRGSPALVATAPVGGSSGNGFPLRRSEEAIASPDSATAEKELPMPPFIRPADIYKRIAEAKERERRESESSSRASMENMGRETDLPASASSRQQQQQQPQQRPLSAVEEREAQEPLKVPENFGEPRERSGDTSTLPPLTGVSSFGNDWFPSGRTPMTTEREERTPTTPKSEQPNSAASSTSLQTTPVATRAPATFNDPAADILAERTHDIPVADIGKQSTSPSDNTLSHQPSAGYRSVVNQAFDHGATSASIPATPISRDNSLSTEVTGVSRSNTDSTSGISPIMSRVPTSNTAQQQQLDREASVPTIAEEPAGRSSTETESNKPSSTLAAVAGVAAVGAAAATAVGVAAGYRRSWDPPSPGNSPARTPVLGSGGDRRLSEGLAAETIVDSTAERVAGSPDRGVETFPTLSASAAESGIEVENPPIDSVEGDQNDEDDLYRSGVAPTQATLRRSVLGFGGSDSDDDDIEDDLYTRGVIGPTPTFARPRAGTDYSMRESDLADAVNSPTSPDQSTRMSPIEAATAERAEQSLFLQTHAGTPTGQIAPVPSQFGAVPPARATTPGSGAASPAKSRVRDMASKFQQIHDDSRRNSQISVTSSKSSWSRFGGDDKNLPQRQDTTTSNMVSESDYGGGEEGLRDEPTRPEIGREESFRPNLPGGWVSYQASPALPVDEYSPVTAPEEDEDDNVVPSAATQEMNTPRASTETQTRSQQVDLTPTSKSVAPQLEGQSHFDQAKTAGAALGASFFSTAGMGHKTRDFGSDDPAQPIDQPEMHPKPATGALGYISGPQRPEFSSRDTDATNFTDIVSATNSIPPTPPAKDTPPIATLSRGVEQGDYYFTGAPLRPSSRSGEASPASAFATPMAAPAATRPPFSPALSWNPRASDMESDRLRKEIVRTLSPQEATEDAERTQDALDAPDNALRVSEGKDALPPAEMAREMPQPQQLSDQQSSQSQSQSRMLLDQRFSWEKVGEDDVFAGFGGPTPTSPPAAPVGTAKDLPMPPKVVEPQPQHSPEIQPEMPYERPRSRNLHIMNTDDDGDEATDERPEEELSRGLSVATSSAVPVSPITKSQENLHLRNMVDSTRAGGDGLTAPSPVSEGQSTFTTRDYRHLDVPGLETVPPQAYQPTGDLEGSSSATAQDFSPTSPTSKQQKIPPFREILAIKSSTDRIRTYDETRRTFADMNTGLSDWLSNMLAQHPEHAGLATPQSTPFTPIVIPPSSTKANPSIAKFARQFSSSAGGSGGNVPVSKVGGDYQASPEPVMPSNREASASPGGAGAGDMDKLQQRGKDLMKNASVLGGKAQAGAKGLLAKGKNRWGSSSKDPSPSASHSASASSSTLPSSGAPRNLSHGGDPSLILQPTPIHANQHPSDSPASSLILPSRSQNQTPNSVSSGSVLSRTLSRLRERSRSKSSNHTSSRRSSKARSLILGNANMEMGGTGIEHPFPPPVVGRVADEPSIQTVSPLISPWIEPNASREVDSSVLLPSRLGVLPSPTAASFATDLDGRSGEGAASSRSIDHDALGLEKFDSNGDEGSGRDEMVQLPARAYGQDSFDTPETSVARNAVEEDDLYGATPVISSTMPHSSIDEDEAHTTTIVTSSSPPKQLDDSGEDDLYDTTPKAVQAPWSAGLPNVADVEKSTENRGVEDEANAVAGAEQVETDDSQPTMLQAVPAAPSDDSSDPHLSLNEGADPTSHVADTGHATSIGEGSEGSGSKRPSVSPLAERPEFPSRFVDAQYEEPIMTSRAVPAGPITSTPAVSVNETDPEEAAKREGDFKDRGYLSRPEIPRPLSYEPDSVQETLKAAQDSQGDDSAVRSIEDAGDEERSFQANFTSLSRHRVVSAGQTSDRRSKRMSGFYGRPSPEPSTIAAAPPPPSAISDIYGLEDLSDLHDESPDAAFPDEMLQQNARQGRRKSGGLWGSFTRSSSSSKNDFSRDPSVFKGDPRFGENMRPSPAPPGSSHSRAFNTQQAPQQPQRAISMQQAPQPQRASTAATETDKKKKRFSGGLSGIFGRSSTTGHKPEKPKKLSKSQQLDTSASQRPAPTGRIGEYDVYMVPPAAPPNPAWGSPYGQGPRPSPMGPPPMGHPSDGWYAPKNEPAMQPGYPRQAPPPNFSRVAPLDPRTGAPFSNAPEGFRQMHPAYNDPRRSSQGSPLSMVSPNAFPYNDPARNIRPPPGPPPSVVSPNAPRLPDLNFQGNRLPHPLAQPPVEQQVAREPARDRQSSVASTEYALSPQISGQSEWQRSRQQRGSTPTISPVEPKSATEGYPGARNVRVGSITQEMARSPAREYMDQQTPWNLAMPQLGAMPPGAMPPGGALPPGGAIPPSDGQAQSSRTSYWARQRRARPSQGNSDMTSEGGMFGGGASGPYPTPPRGPGAFANPSRIGVPPLPAGPYRSTPYNNMPSGAPQLPIFPPPTGDVNSSVPYAQVGVARSVDLPVPPESQQGIDKNGNEDGQIALSTEDQAANPYLSLQLPNLGNNSRRDDSSDNEEYVFRGASYPGQEWIPTQWD